MMPPCTTDCLLCGIICVVCVVVFVPLLCERRSVLQLTAVVVIVVLSSAPGGANEYIIPRSTVQDA